MEGYEDRLIVLLCTATRAICNYGTAQCINCKAMPDVTKITRISAVGKLRAASKRGNVALQCHSNFICYRRALFCLHPNMHVSVITGVLLTRATGARQGCTARGNGTKNAGGTRRGGSSCRKMRLGVRSWWKPGAAMPPTAGGQLSVFPKKRPCRIQRHFVSHLKKRWRRGPQLGCPDQIRGWCGWLHNRP